MARPLLGSIGLVVVLVALLAGPALAGSAEDRFVGTWVARDATGEVELRLDGNGSYAWTQRSAHGEHLVRGRWRLEGDQLLASPESGGLARLRWRFSMVDRLELTDAAGSGVWFTRTTRPGASPPVPAGGAPTPRPATKPAVAVERPRTFVLHRVTDVGGLRDPRNGQTLDVLRLWIPKGWGWQGGIRWKIAGKDPNQVTRGDLASPASIAFRVAAPDGSAFFEVFPEDRFTDTSRMPVAAMFPRGSEYMGTIAWPPLDPQGYVEEILMRKARPEAVGAKMVDASASEALARLYVEEANALNRFLGVTGATATVRAGITTMAYQRGGVLWHERFFVALQYLDLPGATLWWPKVAWSLAAPAEQLPALAPAMLSCVCSVRFDPLWTLLYLKLVNEHARGIAAVDDAIAGIDAAIAASRARTSAQIHKDFQPLLAPSATVKGPGGLEAYVPTGTPTFFNERGEYSTNPDVEGQPGWTKGK